VDLDGGDVPLRSGGVAFKNLDAPVDLACKPLSTWVYVPTCGLGDPDKTNTVRLYVRDKQFRYEYSAWTEVQRNQWFELSMRPSTLAPPGGSKQAGFDPSIVNQIGIEFQAGRLPAGNPEAVYQGKIYLDAVGWLEISGASDGAGCSTRMPPRRR
jgi:hypothetical protein